MRKIMEYYWHVWLSLKMLSIRTKATSMTWLPWSQGWVRFTEWSQQNIILNIKLAGYRTPSYRSRSLSCWESSGDLRRRSTRALLKSSLSRTTVYAQGSQTILKMVPTPYCLSASNASCSLSRPHSSGRWWVMSCLSLSQSRTPTPNISPCST